MSTTATAVVLALVGVAAVVAVSWVFYRVGKSEDREREEAEAARHDEPDDNHRAPGAARERRRPLPPRRPQG
jgi:hypothetical protein